MMTKKSKMEAVLSAIENHVGASIYLGVIIVAVAHNIGKMFTTTHEHYVNNDCSEKED